MARLNLASAVGREVRRRRRAVGLTGAELARALGVDPSSVSMWERGLREPTLDTLEKLAAELGTSVPRLVAAARETHP